MSRAAFNAAADMARYQRDNPGWYGPRYGPPAPAFFAARLDKAVAATAHESRADFWARREAAGTTFGLVPRPPIKGGKRGPSKIVLALQARVAELEATLAATVAAPVVAESPEVTAYAARVAELEAQVRGFERWGVAS